MKLYYNEDNYKLYQGNMLDMLENISSDSIDSIVTDPPYELNFMGKKWDKQGISFQADTWKYCYEVLKPGGYLLAFGGSRTFHKITTAIEEAGFEIRDTIMWLYGSGFPKSQNISKALDKKFGKERPIISYTKNAGIAKNAKPDSTGSHIWSGNIISDEPITDLAKQWKGCGTALKPSFEPIIVARKRFKGSLVDNVIKHGVGGLNIDECRVEPTGKDIGNYGGRFPANTILTYDETDKDEVCGGFPNTKSTIRVSEDKHREQSIFDLRRTGITPRGHNDCGSAARYFYCAKASNKDRDEGLDEFKNIHPTVKPTNLMQYLIRLVTPNGGTILDPFNGSGSTGKAAMYENIERNKNYKYIGIELNEEYLDISKARINYVLEGK